MRSVPHSLKRTPIASVLAAMDEYRRSRRWSREALVQDMVDVHNQINGPAATEIEFAAPLDPKDVAGPQKVNAERVYRWMDETKDRNHLPFNAHIAIYGGLPLDVRIKLMNELYNPIGVVVRPIENTDCELNAASMLSEVLKEGAEAKQSIVALLDGATPEELTKAHSEISDAIAAFQKALRSVESAMAGCK